MSPLRVVIADDEPAARHAMTRALQPIEEVTVVGEAATGTEALELARSLAPDILFLDIRMPGMSGLEVAENLRDSHGPAVVFVTAYDEFAVAAFEHAALDYLVKPVDPERVAESVVRLLRSSAPRIGEVAEPLLRHIRDAAPGSAPLRVGGSIRFVEPDSVRYLEAAGNYVRVHAGVETHLVRGTVPNLMDRLGGDLIRVHRSYAIRLSEIAEIRRSVGHDPVASLRGGEEIPIGRTFWPVLSQRLES